MSNSSSVQQYNIIHKKILVLFFFLSIALISLITIMGKKMLMPSTNTISTIQIYRPSIVDRNGIIIATSIQIQSVYLAVPRIIDKAHAIKVLHAIFPEISYEVIQTKINSSSPFILFKKNATQSQIKAIIKEKIVGIEIIDEVQRLYPHGNLLSHVIGHVNSAQEGSMGLERWIDAQTSVNYNDDESGCDNTSDSSSCTIRTSIDIRIQHIIRQELTNAIAQFNAQFAGAILVDMKTGEILALVSLPDFDPSNVHSPNSVNMFNIITNGIYEFGSSAKLFTLAMVIENSDYKNITYDVSKPIKIDRFIITDTKPYNGSFTIEEAAQKSSNIAFAKAALNIGRETQVEFFNKIELFAPITLELFEIGKPISPASNSRVETIVNAYGYGFAVTALHMVNSSIKVLYNHDVKLTLLKKSGSNITSAFKNTAISRKSCEATNEMLCKNSKGWHAKCVSNIMFHGKTGTANTKENGKYIKKQNLTSFIGVFPSEKPRYIIMVIIGRPQASAQTWGWATSFWFTLPIARNVINMASNFLA
jgi:cell division protein FtsI (penicillin-binding protein 3)